MTRYVGEIRMIGGNFAPVGWEFCEGQLLPISEYTTLFNLIGTTYGGDGQETFALPDLRGRVPIHMGISTSGVSYVIGETGGVEAVVLSSAQMPSHYHLLSGSSLPVYGSNPGSTFDPRNAYPAMSPGNKLYSTVSINGGYLPSSSNFRIGGNSGGSQPHTNMQPFLCVNFIIALEGMVPSEG